MAEDYSYDQLQQQQPSAMNTMFGSPARAWWTLQKASVTMTGLNGGTWSALKAGEGFGWKGVVGFRGIALGRSGTGLKTGSPSKLISGIIGQFDKSTAARFDKFGVFGGRQNEIAKSVGKIFGGGTIESTKFDNVLLKEFDDVKVPRKFIPRFKRGLKMTDPEFEMFLNQKAGQAMSTGVPSATAYGSYRDGLKKEITGTLKKRSFIRGVATVGKFASWAMMASIAYDVGSSIGSYTANTIGDFASMAEKKLSNISNNQMEFGGKVGIGFYSGASSTERQRALNAIKGAASPGFGNEAAYQHVGNTW